MYHWTYYLHPSLPVQARGLKTTPSHVSSYKNSAFYIRFEYYLLNILKPNSNTYKPQGLEEHWHLDCRPNSGTFLIQTSLQYVTQTCLLCISSDRLVAQEKRQWPLGLVPFWTPPVKQGGEWLLERIYPMSTCSKGGKITNGGSQYNQ